MVGWHHQLSRHEFEQIVETSEGQGNLVCSSPWGHTESDTTEPLNNKCRLLTEKELAFDSEVILFVFRCPLSAFLEQLMYIHIPEQLLPLKTIEVIFKRSY